MSRSLAITINVLADVALLGGLGDVTSQTRRLTPRGCDLNVPDATPAPGLPRFAVHPSRSRSPLQPVPSPPTFGLSS
jgi:hypothetical protein